MFWDAVTGGFNAELTTNIGSGTPGGIKLTMYLQGSNDELRVQMWDYQIAVPTWKTIGKIEGTNQAVTQVIPLDAFIGYVGIGANKGDIRIRLYNDNGTVDTALTAANIYIDQMFVEFSPSAASTLDRIYFDSNASNTNTVPGHDGIPGNPVSTMAAVNTLLAATGLNRIEVAPASTATLAAAQSNQVFSGENWVLELGSQNIAGSAFIGADVSGIAGGTGTRQTFRKCHMNAVTHIKGTHVHESGVADVQTAGEAGEYHFDRCHSSIAGLDTWTFNFGTAIGTTNLNWRNGSGGIQLEAMGDTGIDTASIEGRGQIIEGTCTGGIVAVRGAFTTSGITNLTLSDNARIDTLQIKSEADTALADYDGPTHAEIIARTLLADDYFDPATNQVIVGQIGNNVITAASIAAGALDNKGNWNVGKAGYALTITPPTAVQIRQEMDANSVDLNALLAGQVTINNNIGLIPTTPMRGTDGANTVIPDPAGTAPTLVEIVDGLLDEALSGHNLGGSVAKAIRQTKEGTVSVESSVNDLAATTTSFITSLTETTDDHYEDVSLVFTNGALIGQSRPILGYDGTTKTITLDEPLTEAPVDGAAFIIKTDHVHPLSEIVAGVLAGGDIDGFVLEKALKIILAAAGGKASGFPTNAIAIRAADDSKDRINATVDEFGNRSAVTLNGDG